MPDVIEPVVYQFKVVLRRVSPMIWRRLLVHSDSSIADFHYTLQIAMGWSDSHLHRFRIYGKDFGVYHIGGPIFDDNPKKIRLANFCFRPGERFLYEYDFGDAWQHDIRLERILSLETEQTYPVCIAGKRSAPPEDCGGAWKFIQLRQRYSPAHGWSVLLELKEAVEAEEQDVVEGKVEEIRKLLPWLALDRFDRRAVNRRLKQYTTGDEAWMWKSIGRRV
jgi:pRiA4b ORF-3-like protein